MTSSAESAEYDDLIELLMEDRSHYGSRCVDDLGTLEALVDRIRDRQGAKIVLTSGSFDVIHEGHSMYLEAERLIGDSLVVGVDSDG